MDTGKLLKVGLLMFSKIQTKKARGVLSLGYLRGFLSPDDDDSDSSDDSMPLPQRVRTIKSGIITHPLLSLKQT